MGRKGGGQKGFMKQASKSRGPETEETSLEESSPPPTDSTLDPAENAPESAKENVSDAVGDGENEGGAPRKAESKSQLKERHKKELAAHKKAMAQLGKKKKSEAARLTEELKARHAAELAAFSRSSDQDENEEEEGENDSKDQAGGSGSQQGAGLSLYGDKLGEGGGDKKTKAQKRREKAAKKEAERDARIAKEHEEMGESSRELEERELNAKLQPLGLRVFDIKADGHCLYRALNHQLCINQEKSGGKDWDDAYENLRQEAASYLRQNKEDFLPFFVGDESGLDPEGAFEKHCERVEGTAEWGGEMELRALAHALKKPIVVHSLHLPDTTLGEEYLSEGEPLRVCFMKHAYRLGDHYNSVEAI